MCVNFAAPSFLSIPNWNQPIDIANAVETSTFIITLLKMTVQQCPIDVFAIQAPVNPHSVRKPSCEISSIEQMVTCVPPTHHTRMKQTVMSFLQSHSLLFVQEVHCHHCGCLWDTSANGPFCSRCRADYYFIVPDSLSSNQINNENEHDENEEEDDEQMVTHGKRRKISSSSSSSSSSSRHVQRCYRWCKGCNEYHWSGYGNLALSTTISIILIVVIIIQSYHHYPHHQ